LTSNNNVTVNIQLQSNPIVGALMNADSTAYNYNFADVTGNRRKAPGFRHWDISRATERSKAAIKLVVGLECTA
jgi:hypothetical protein